MYQEVNTVPERKTKRLKEVAGIDQVFRRHQLEYIEQRDHSLSVLTGNWSTEELQ